MRNKSLLWVLLLGTICLSGSVSCQKEMVGKQIHFKASTRPEGPQTKTSYSGETSTENTKTYERIDWVAGDGIRLAMTNEAQTTPAIEVYQITGITTSGRYSTAGLEPVSSGLEWGTGTHDFWAAYPSTATAGDHTISFSIPSVQQASYVETKNDIIRFAPDMGKAFMVAGSQCDPTNGGVNLDFYPGFTAFEFTVGADASITVTSFEMETETYETETSTIVPICGTAVASFDTNDNMSYAFSTADSPSPGQTITVSFDDGSNPATISSATSMNFKVFALPQNLTGIVIRFYLSNGIQHSLKLKQSNAWLTFRAGVKYNISGLLVPGAAWYISFEGPGEEQWITTDIEIPVE